MRVASGKVVGGKVVFDEQSFVEGATVTVIAREDDESFVASPELEAALVAALSEAERGETISGEEILARVRSRS
jgi:hypothetical protein